MGDRLAPRNADDADHRTELLRSLGEDLERADASVGEADQVVLRIGDAGVLLEALQSSIEVADLRLGPGEAVRGRDDPCVRDRARQQEGEELAASAVPVEE